MGSIHNFLSHHYLIIRKDPRSTVGHRNLGISGISKFDQGAPLPAHLTAAVTCYPIPFWLSGL